MIVSLYLDNYNKKIPPFQLDPTTNLIKKAMVNVSVDVVDLISLTEVGIAILEEFKHCLLRTCL